MNKKYLAVFIFFILFPYVFKYNILEFFGDDFLDHIVQLQHIIS